MTKDRRLGRGLAALLGTPIEGEEGDFVERPSPQVATVEEASVKEAPSGFEATSGIETGSVAGHNAGAGLAGAVQRAVRDGSVSTMGSRSIDVSMIDANPFQPRREFNPEEIASLAESIKAHEQLQPILVRKVGERYQLISGERRLRATIHAGLTTIRAEVREADDRLVSELAIIENLQRKDLNAIEKAMSFKRYIQEHRCTQEELANRLKIDRSTVANMMRLLELPEPILEMIQKNLVTVGHAKAILSLSTVDQQLSFAESIVREGWSVRETERRVAEQIALEEAEESGATGAASRNKSKTKSDQVAMLEQQFKRQLGTKVEIKSAANGRGKIVISFSNAAEFDRLQATLCGYESVAKAA